MGGVQEGVQEVVLEDGWAPVTSWYLGAMGKGGRWKTATFLDGGCNNIEGPIDRCNSWFVEGKTGGCSGNDAGRLGDTRFAFKLQG